MTQPTSDHDLTPVERLHRQLRDPATYAHAPSVARVRVAEALADHAEDPEAAELLMELARDEYRPVRQAATAALARVFAARPSAVLECTESREGRPGLHVCYRALARFAHQVDSPEAIDVLLVALERARDEDDSTWLRDRVARTGLVSTEVLRARLRAAEDDQDDTRAELLAEILVRRDDDAGFLHLLQADAREGVDRLAARGPDGIRRLCRLGEALEPDDQERVAARLAKRPARAATVRTIVRDRRAAGIQVAIATLGHWDEPENVEILLAMVRDHGCASDLRDLALQALCAMEAPEALDEMCQALTDESIASPTRCKCADAVAAIGNWAALPALEAAAQADGTLGVVAREAMVAIRSGVDVSCP